MARGITAGEVHIQQHHLKLLRPQPCRHIGGVGQALHPVALGFQHQFRTEQYIPVIVDHEYVIRIIGFVADHGRVWLAAWVRVRRAMLQATVS